jgi:signal transduction histidine kinase
MTLRAKLPAVTASIVAGVMLGTLVMVSRSQKGVLEANAERRIDSLVEGVARVAQESMGARDELMLYSFLRVLRRQHPELAFVTVLRGGRTPRTVGEESPGLRIVTQSVPATPDSDEIQIRFGLVRQVLDDELAQAFKPMLAKTLSIGAVFMALGVFAALYFVRRLTEPLRALSDAVAAVGRGNMDLKVPEGSQDELGALAKSFNRMTGSLKDLMRFREDVLHTLTHELNTPLAGLKGYLELWQDGKLDGDRQREALDTMMSAVGRMETSLGSALLLFRAEERERHPERNKLVWVNEILNEQGALFSAVAQSKKISLHPLGKDEVGCIYTEEDLLRQVSTNLLSNAVKYTQEGGDVRIGLKSTDEDLTFWVADTGPGIPAESLKTIFEKFDRSGAGGKSASFGTGLGLSIAKKAVEAMNGRIWVESLVGKGATFYVSMPKQSQAKTAEVA